MKLEKFKQRDPKKIGITIFTVVCILLVAGVFFYTSFASFEVKQDFKYYKWNSRGSRRPLLCILCR